MRPPSLVQVALQLLVAVLVIGCNSHVTQPRTATPEEERRLYPQLHPELKPHATVAVSQQNPGAQCTLIGEVGADEGSTDDPYSELKARAQELGGNYLVPLGSRPSGLGWGYRVKYEARGRVYRCAVVPQLTTSAASTMASPAAHCEPACSPGFTCLRATCVSACNPSCPSGMRCNQERICVPLQ